MLVGLAVIVALGNLVLGLFVAWGLSGGDGEAPNLAAPVLGIAVFAAAVAAVVQALGALAGAAMAWTLATAVVTAVVWMWWLSTHTEDRDRRRAYPVLALVALALPVALGAAGAVSELTWRRVVIAAFAPALLVLSLPVVTWLGPRQLEWSAREGFVVLAAFSLPPVLLCIAVLAA